MGTRSVPRRAAPLRLRSAVVRSYSVARVSVALRQSTSDPIPPSLEKPCQKARETAPALPAISSVHFQFRVPPMRRGVLRNVLMRLPHPGTVSHHPPPLQTNPNPLQSKILKPTKIQHQHVLLLGAILIEYKLI